MAIKLKDMKTDETGMTLAASQTLAMSEMLSRASVEIQQAAAEAAEKSMRYAETLKRDILDSFRTELAAIPRPRPQVMAVEIDGATRKLSRPAVPYLAEMLTVLKCGYNVMLVGPAGCGKTTAATQVAEALGLEFATVCMTAGASESWLMGRQTPNGFREASFSRMFRDGGVFLIDEIDNADANMLLSINTAIENGILYNPISGETHRRHPNFILIAAANTYGKGGDGVYTGRNRLDAATLRRFYGITVDYDGQLEEGVCPNAKLREKLQTARNKLRELNAREVISTGCLARAYTLINAGLSEETVIRSLTASWPVELRTQVGL